MYPIDINKTLLKQISKGSYKELRINIKTLINPSVPITALLTKLITQNSKFIDWQLYNINNHRLED